MKRRIFDLETQVSNFNSVKIELENKIAQLAMEIERNQMLIQSKTDELENLKRQLFEARKEIERLREYEIKHKKLDEELTRLEHENHQMKSELDEWRFKYA